MISMTVGKPYHHWQYSIFYSHLSPLPLSLSHLSLFLFHKKCPSVKEAHHTPLTSCPMDIQDNQDKAKYYSPITVDVVNLKYYGQFNHSVPSQPPDGNRNYVSSCHLPSLSLSFSLPPLSLSFLLLPLSEKFIASLIYPKHSPNRYTCTEHQYPVLTASASVPTQQATHQQAPTASVWQRRF